MKQVRVLQITHDLQIGGLQRVVVDLAKGLDRNKYLVSVCALRDGGPLEKELIDAGVEVIRLPPLKGRPDYFGVLKLYKIIRQLKPAVVHTHNTHPMIDGVSAALLARVPVTVHTDHARKFPDKRRYMFAEWVLSHFVSQYVAVSEQTKCDLIRYEKISKDRIKVVFNGILGEKYKKPINKQQKREELGISRRSAPILGVVARLAAEKGVLDVLDAMQLLRDRFPEILLVIAGEGELWEELIAKVDQMALQSNVLLLGPRHDVHEILQIVDLFVLASHREGLPLVLLEAAAASLAIVATDVGGNRQVVHEGVNGSLVQPKDPYQLYDAIKRLCEDRKLRETYSRNSLGIFQGQFDLGVTIEKYEAIYWECLNVAGSCV